MKVLIDVEQMKKLLVIAQERGTVDSWIRLAVEWMEEASKQATAMRDELKEYKKPAWSSEDIDKAMAMRGDSRSTNSSAERLQEKVVCPACDGAGKLYSNNMVYPCMACQDWYRGSR